MYICIKVREAAALTRAVIDNMLTRDKILLLLSDDDDEPDKRVVGVHPNFVAE
jgi:hypothetical protein